MSRFLVHRRLVAMALTAVVGLVLAAEPAPTPAPEHKLALVIGNADYRAVAPLTNPLNDAADMCAALRRVGYDATCVTNLATPAAFQAELERFASQLQPRSKGLFYYAGHALQVGGENYLIPTHAQLRSLNQIGAELLPVQRVLDRLKRAGNDFNLLALDACRDNPFAAAVAAASAAGADRGGAASRRGAAVPSLLADGRGPASKGREVSFGLGAIRDAPVGSIVLYATAADDTAFDGTGRNGLLTKHLLSHIETRGINVEEMIKRVTAAVQDETSRTLGRRQTPFVYSSFTGEFCFAGCAPRTDPAEVERLKEKAADLEKTLKQNERTRKTPARVLPPTL